MAEKDFEKDVTIGKVYKGKGGESQHGPWQIWNFYLDDPDDKRKFTWFEKDGLIPIEGMSVKAMEFEISETHKDGKTYLNHTVKWFKLNSTPNAPQKSTQSAPASTGGTFSKNEGNGIGPMTMWGKYIGEVVCAFIGKGLIGNELDAACKDAMETFADCLVIFERQYTNVNIAEPEPYKPTLGPGDDYPPIGDPPPF